MSHYICKGGCKGVSDIPGTCQTDDCVNKGHELEECSCEKNCGVEGSSCCAFEERNAEEKPEEVV